MVYFDNGSSTLSGTAKSMLDSLAYHNILQQGKLYTITGYTDIVGGESSNSMLSTKRAKAVSEYIASFGLRVETVSGNGEIDRPENSEGYPQDRKVDIIATKQSKLPDIKTLKKGDVFDLENMFFYGGQAIMKPESKPVLDMLLKIMQDNKNLKIRIEGHVHCSGYNSSFRQQFVTLDGKTIGKADYNNDTDHYYGLSAARARMVRNYLVTNKVDSTRLQYAGLACKEMKLHPDNNRRVAVRILEK